MSSSADEHTVGERSEPSDLRMPTGGSIIFLSPSLAVTPVLSCPALNGLLFPYGMCDFLLSISPSHTHSLSVSVCVSSSIGGDKQSRSRRSWRCTATRRSVQSVFKWSLIPRRRGSRNVVFSSVKSVFISSNLVER